MSYKIYIGVGHGGSDPGAVSGVHKEADYALDIANACTAELKRHGVEVMQSRTSDIYESATAKIKECNAFAPDLAADFHLNSAGGDGLEIYYSIRGGDSKKLAAAIEKAVVAETKQNSRGLKIKTNQNGKDYFGFIRQTNCPAILAEFAFIDSNDVSIIDTLAERQAMGRAAAMGILTYLGIDRKNETASESSVSSTENVNVTLPVLRRGADNPEYQVERVQLCLNQMGWTGADEKALAVDGDFGENTEAAIKKLQASHSIDTDGILSAKTWRALLVFMK